MSIQEKTSKKWYQKWWIWLIGVVFILFMGAAVSSIIIDVTKEYDVPNVIGVSYEDAEKVLDENGFSVTAVEADAGSILSSGSSFNRSVKKGVVFKVNDETYPEYNITTKDKKVTIYYAKEDYVYEGTDDDEDSAENTDYDDGDDYDDDDDVESSNTAQSSGGWKEFLKDYEKWADKYIELLKKMKKNPDDLSLFTEYSKLLEEFEKWTDESEKYEEALSNSPEALSEYLSTTTRILNKISEASK